VDKITLDYKNKILIIHEDIKIVELDDIACRLRMSVGDIFDWKIRVEHD
jgi:hypothetical protein